MTCNIKKKQTVIRRQVLSLHHNLKIISDSFFLKSWNKKLKITIEVLSQERISLALLVVHYALLHVLCRFRHRKNFFFHCYHSYLYFVQVSLVSMPQVMKVDSVWTTLVETPHPSLKTKDKILHVPYLLYLPGNLKS